MLPSNRAFGFLGHKQRLHQWGTYILEKMLSWLDLIALFMLACAIALGIRQGVPFTLAVIPTVLLYLVLASFMPVAILPGVALVLGLVMAFLTQYLPIPRLTETLEAALGGVGGFAWGLLLAITIWVSFPGEFVTSSGTYRYPSANLPVVVQSGISSSAFARPLFGWAVGNPFLKSVFIPQVRER